MNDDQCIRVLRLIEYEYENVEAMTEDMADWTLSGPPAIHVRRKPGWRMRFRSSSLPPTIQNQLLEPEPESVPDAGPIYAVCPRHGLVQTQFGDELLECPVPGCTEEPQVEGRLIVRKVGLTDLDG